MWVRIDGHDKNTHPPCHRRVMIYMPETQVLGVWDSNRIDPVYYAGMWWRPLTEFDFPPGEIEKHGYDLTKLEEQGNG